MSHRPEKNASWKEEKNQRYGRKKILKQQLHSPRLITLIVSDNIKAIMSTKYKMESTDIENMLNNTSLN